MGKRVATGLLLGALAGVAMVGCSLLDASTTELPLINVPNSVARFPQSEILPVNPRAGATASSSAGGGFGGGGGGAPLFGVGANGINLFLGCPGDTAVDGSIIPDYDCTDFNTLTQVTQFFTQLNQRLVNNNDCHTLDSNSSGTPCDQNGLPP